MTQSDDKNELYQELENLRKENDSLKKSNDELKFCTHLKTILECAGEGIFGLDVQGKHTFVNPKGAAMLGYEIDELIGKPSHTLWHHTYPDGSHFPREECPIYESFKTGNTYRGESYFWRKDGTGFYVDFVAMPLIDNEKINGSVVSFFDISERIEAEIEQFELIENLNDSKEMIEQSLFEKNSLIYELSITKEKLEKINSEKDKFFSIIAHDLKGPFNGFLGLSKIIAEEYQDLTLKEVQELGKNMHESANNLFKLLENLLEWARMQKGSVAFNPELCMLTFIVKQNLGIVGEFAKQKEIKFIDNIYEGAQVTADIPMLNTVLRNLISNAIKFTPRGGNIEIGIKDFIDQNQKTNDCIYVKDSGIGIDAETIGKLFLLDQKVSRPGTENEPSTGLGLILCKDFIEKHGGNIWVESEEGNGTTFYFTLPKTN
ncbi:MAG: PAS domain-containing sensor histidine kinase [Candidatus Kapabacteria bacterium]|nr:PAS domain-containing sensor histidine kinase [Candidatus Kapabacteria bacterium]